MPRSIVHRQLVDVHEALARVLDHASLRRLVDRGARRLRTAVRAAGLSDEAIAALEDRGVAELIRSRYEPADE